MKHETGASSATVAEPRPNQTPQDTVSRGKSTNDEERLPTSARARLGSTRWRHKSNVAVTRFSPDGTVVATAADSDAIRLWEVVTGRQLNELADAGRWLVYGLVFSPDGKKLMAIMQGGAIRSWNLSTGKQVADSRKHPGEAYERYGLARSADGKLIATVGAKDVRTWDADSLMPLASFPTAGSDVHETKGIAFSPDGKLPVAAPGSPQ